MNKRISFPIAIIIIVVLAVAVGGLTGWQYLALKKEKEDSSECLKAGERNIRGGVPTEEGLESLKPCCTGLEAISAFDEEHNGECIFTVGGYGYICAPCGNGKCESKYGENRCNCPEDCK